MHLTYLQRKYIKKRRHKLTPSEIASKLNIPEKDITAYIQKTWGQNGYQPKPAITSSVIPIAFNARDWITKNWLILTVLALLVWIGYINALTNEFISDDIPYLIKNPFIKSFKFVTDSPVSFLRGLLFFSLYKLFGFNQVALRIPNILFHIANVWLLYLIVYLLKSKRTAIFASCLYAVHPILIESITWITGGIYVQYTFFFLLSLCLYIIPSSTSYIFSIVMFFLMLLTTEKSIALSLVFVSYELLLGNIKKNWKRLVPYVTLTAVWVFFIFVILRYAQLRLDILQSSFYQPSGFYNPLVQIPVAISTYLYLLVWPAQLSLYHSELAMTIPGYIIRIIVLILFFITAIYFIKKNRLVAFGISLFIISLLPTLTPLQIAWVVAERYVYLGTAGIFIGIGMLFDKYTGILKFKYGTIILFACITTALLTRTIIRNNDWKNPDVMWIALGKTAPSDPKTHNNLGDMYGRHKQYDKAIIEFQKAINLEPRYADAYHNLANIYLVTNQIPKALEMYQKALQINPGLWQSYVAIGFIYDGQKKYQDALTYLVKAAQINPNDATIFVNIGIAYNELGDKNRAKEMFNKALLLDSENSEAKRELQNLQ